MFISQPACPSSFPKFVLIIIRFVSGEDSTVRVQAFCNNNDFTVDLPKVNSWIGVRVTAVANPAHFWVQFPCGSGPIEKKIIEGTRAAYALNKYGRETEHAIFVLTRACRYVQCNVKGPCKFRTHYHTHVAQLLHYVRLR